VQGQDLRGALLAIRARSEGLSAADVERALNGRELVITWLNRGTLHLVRSEDYPWLQALTTPPLRVMNARRLAQEGLEPADAERAVAVVERALAYEGPLDRERLRERVRAAGIRVEGQALVHVLMLASLRGLVVRGPISAGRHAFVLVREWLGEPRPVEREAALAELARRYLAGHAPADERDLAKWTGLPLRDVRAGLRALGPALVERPDGLLEPRGAATPPPLPPPRLLGQYDPLLHGWCSREEILGEAGDGIVTVNGLFRPFALVRGRAAAVWSLRDGKVRLQPFAPLGQAVAAALAEDAADVVRYLGLAGGRQA
jgi:hypothetical protein